MKKQFTFLGENLYNSNPHWLKTYGQLLIFLSEVKIEETVPLLDFPPDETYGEYQEYLDGVNAVSDLLHQYGYYFEGYTFDQVYEWLIWYFNDWNDQNKEVQIKVKKDKIEKLKKELEELEQK